MHSSHMFTKLVVDDLDAMARYYAEVHGLAPVQRLTAELAGSPIEEIMLGIDGTFGGLILLKWLGQSAPSVGEVLLGFGTSDVHALFDRATAAGGVVRQEPQSSPEANGMLVGLVADPEGHVAEVVETPR